MKNLIILAGLSLTLCAQQPAPPAAPSPANSSQAMESRLDVLLKRTDDVMWTLGLCVSL